ncbi:MAG: toprim domain-containing protein [Desulfovibrionaceae bacterium]|nr:toprim domain-containing protein [Desulfovibrionaceae bacterium]
MNVLIVESPGKVKKIQSILGSNWKVAASVGHVRDLPERELGVSVPDFKPDYAPTDTKTNIPCLVRQFWDRAWGRGGRKRLQTWFW